MNNAKTISIADPYNNNHIDMFINFERENNISANTKTTSSYLIETSCSMSKEQYEINSKLSNEFETSLFTSKEDKILDSCYIKGEKDVKTCMCFFAPLSNSPKKRPLINETMDYAFNVLGMEEVFVSTSQYDRNLTDNLNELGFESLGTSNGSNIYIKEKEDTKEIGRLI